MMKRYVERYTYFMGGMRFTTSEESNEERRKRGRDLYKPILFSTMGTSIDLISKTNRITIDNCYLFDQYVLCFIIYSAKDKSIAMVMVLVQQESWSKILGIHGID